MFCESADLYQNLESVYKLYPMIFIDVHLIYFTWSISRSFSVAAHGSISFFFMAELYSIVHMSHIFCIQSSVGGHFACFGVSVVVYSAVMHVGVRVGFRTMVVSGCLPRSGIGGSDGSSMFCY